MVVYVSIFIPQCGIQANTATCHMLPKCVSVSFSVFLFMVCFFIFSVYGATVHDCSSTHVSVVYTDCVCFYSSLKCLSLYLHMKAAVFHYFLCFALFLPHLLDVWESIFSLLCCVWDNVFVNVVYIQDFNWSREMVL